MPPSPLQLDALIPRSPSALLYVLAYLVGTAAFALMARRRGMATGGVWSLAVVALLGGLVGANLAQLLATGSPGKSVLGGVAGGYLSVFLYKRAIGLRRPTGDLFAVALMAGESVGRWGCYVGGCCFGRLAPDGVSRYPAQLFLSAACAAILAVLVAAERRRVLPENGLFFLQGALYAAARFVIEFYRTADPVALGLTAAQWGCLAALLFFGAGLYRLARRSKTAQPVAPQQAVPAAQAAGAG